MNLLLEKKYKYIVLVPIDDVRSKLKSILKTPWYDIEVNFWGQLFNDNNFRLHPKIAFQRVALVTGKLERNGEQTNIHIKVSPRIEMLLFFYTAFLFFLFKLVGAIASGSEDDWLLAIAVFFGLLFIRGLIYFSMYQLKNRFEKIMSVHPED